MDRRSFLIGGIKAGIGVGLGARSVRELVSPGSVAASPGGVVAQPSPPLIRRNPSPTSQFFGLRQSPGPHPGGVSINATPELLELGPKPGYIFCAPKAPAGGQPRKCAAAATRSRPARHQG